MNWWVKDIKKVGATLNVLNNSFCDYWMYYNFCSCFFTGIPIGIKSSITRLETCALTAGIKNISP